MPSPIVNAKIKPEPIPKLLRNKNLLLLWSAQFISRIGDDFFNIAVMWAVYSQSGSTFQSALVGVVWHLSDILFAPIAGVIADKWDRKKIMLVTNALAALITLLTALTTMAIGKFPLSLALFSIFSLNCFTTFLNPARASVLPDIVHKGQLAQANGIFSSVIQISSLLGSALAGFIITLAGATWAILGDSISFFIVCLFIVLISLPQREIDPESYTNKRLMLFKDLKKGWNYVRQNKQMRSIVFLTLFVNISSFLGPLYPALIKEQLKGGALTYGIIQSACLIGGILAGFLIGKLERKIGAGKLLSFGWILAGICIFGVGLSQNIILSTLLFSLQIFGITLGGVSLNSIILGTVTQEFRGRITGICTSLSVFVIPISTFIAGWLGEFVDISILFIIGSVFVLISGIFAAFNPLIRDIIIK